MRAVSVAAFSLARPIARKAVSAACFSTCVCVGSKFGRGGPSAASTGGVVPRADLYLDLAVPGAAGGQEAN